MTIPWAIDCYIGKLILIGEKMETKEKIYTHDTCPLNPETNANYAEEIEKSFGLLQHSPEAEFLKLRSENDREV